MTQSRKILIVDDGEDMAELISDIVQMKHFEPLTTFGAEEGLERLRDENVIGAFVDMFMPEMDGIEFIHSVGQVGPSIPIVLMSGHDATYMRYAKDIGECRNINIVGMLAKPFSVSEASDMIDRMAAYRPDNPGGADRADAGRSGVAETAS